MKTASSIAAMVLAASTLLACGGQDQTTGPTATKGAASARTGEVIATVGDDVITVDDFSAKMEEQSPFIRARYSTLERKREFLDNLVQFEVLAQEAQRRGLQNDPEVVATMKKVMVQKLMRAEFDENQGAEIPEPELRAFYDANMADYVKPERVRVSHIFIAAEKGSADRTKAKSTATRLLAEVRGKEAGPIKTAFADAAKSTSDDEASKKSGGDLLFKTQDELAEIWGATFAQSVAGMKSIGDIGGVVETDRGFHLIKLTGRQNALDRPFESVKSQIQNRLFREKRTRGFEEFVAGLKEKANVQVKDDVLAAIDIATPTRAQALAEGIEPPPGSVAAGVIPAKGEEPVKMMPAEEPPAGGANPRQVGVPAHLRDLKLKAPLPQRGKLEKKD